MGRGFFWGAFWGLVVSGVALIGASQMAERVRVIDAGPQAAAVDVPGGSEFNRERPESEPVIPQIEAAPDASAPSLPEAAEAEDSAGGTIDPLDPPLPVAPVAVPGTDGVDAPPVIETDPGAPGSDTPVLPAPGVVPPSQPTSDDLPEATTEAPEPAVMPEVVDEPTQVAEPLPDAVEAVTAPDAPQPDSPPAMADAADLPVPPVDPGAAPSLPAQDDMPVAQQEAPAAAEPVEIAEAPAMPGQPTGGFDDMAPDVTTGRLPSIGDDATDSAPAPEAAAPASAVSALDRHAAKFTVPEGVPLVGIVLVDNGAAPFGGDLANFPLPLAIAVDAEASDATARMARYRALGLEVLAMVRLPEGAAPSDTLVTLNTVGRLIPEAIGVIDGEEGSYQAISRQSAEALVGWLEDRGMGLITYPVGLNMPDSLAERLDAPRAVVFRVFDEGGRDIAAMKRFLDHAAFRAGVEQRVMLVGHLQAETLAALLEWRLGSRAASVVVAPPSALLKASVTAD